MSTDITPAAPGGATGGALAERPALEMLPDFMQEGKGGAGLENVGRYVMPERIKCVQKMARAPISELFNFGDLILTPSLKMLAAVALNPAGKPEHTKGGAPFHFVPLFQFTEFLCFNPIATQGTLPNVRARSYDENSEVAQIARNGAKRNAIPCDEKPSETLKFREVISFIVSLVGNHPLAGTPQGSKLLLPFMSSGFKHGSAFCRTLSYRVDTRTGRRADIFGCVFEGRACFETNNKGDEFYNVQVFNPSAESGMPPYVTDAAAYKAFGDEHAELKRLHASRLIVTNYDDDGEELDDGGTSPGSTKHEF